MLAINIKEGFLGIMKCEVVSHSRNRKNYQKPLCSALFSCSVACSTSRFSVSHEYLNSYKEEIKNSTMICFLGCGLVETECHHADISL